MRDIGRLMGYSNYLHLDSQYLAGKIDSVEFAREFNRLYLGDQTSHAEEIFNVLETLFYFVDAYEPSTKLRRKLDTQIGEEELKQAARNNYIKLKEMSER